MLQILSELRKNKNWSQAETAELLGIAKSTYAGYESGYREPSLRALIQIADLFDVSIDVILARKNQTTVLELATISKMDSIVLTVDGKPLTEEETANLIAFTRVRRELG
ncbi:helix-turn-helix domain-containing protein [Niallia taxi]|uniref:helix-turn-helix domain-containing protein n=1 Tax=Niallia taxi TaxID=2499688 RepID=UPI0011A030A9|nr:helix-turn-helix transcriptional regulator [Niallia taxi]MCT2343002.1 helix-turn-helix transcriptional regulator [Niallia taxi]MDE5051258.1 helix-turn-helix transcriptional regulator [Niallia taxi]MED3964521.1 helix-turn-helix transcriptional regulator [Niallia taxi]WOD62300.1 helix-turn-helix transcriptional regulator [Niallia taxi]